jgi:hypothetical protein
VANRRDYNAIQQDSVLIPPTERRRSLLAFNVAKGGVTS